MKRLMLFSGIILLIVAALLIYISGIMNVSGSIPVYPVLYSLQILWTLLAVAGLSLTIAGIVFKNKKK